VLEIDPDNKRISLGLKQLKEDPWEKIAEKYHAGDAVRGKVTKIVSFGAFVELEEGIEGLLHTSRMEKRETPISEGDVLDVQIVNVEHEQRKIGLDMPSGPRLPNEQEQAGPDDEISDN
jgi:small subunit ribosomal protein S1